MVPLSGCIFSDDCLGVAFCADSRNGIYLVQRCHNELLYILATYKTFEMYFLFVECFSDSFFLCIVNILVYKVFADHLRLLSVPVICVVSDCACQLNVL